MPLVPRKRYTLFCDQCDKQAEWDGELPLPKGWYMLQGVGVAAFCSMLCVAEYSREAIDEAMPVELPWVAQGDDGSLVSVSLKISKLIGENND
jgi:hypothetical protein